LIRFSEADAQPILTRMFEGQQNRIDGRRKSSVLGTVAWIVIVVMLILIACLSVWASHQPNVTSIWAPE